MSISSFAPRLFSPSSQSTQESMEDSSSERNASTNNDNNNNAFLMPGGMNLTTSPTARGNKFIPNVRSSSTNVSLISHHHHAQDRDYGPEMETTRTKSDNGQPITSPSSLDDKDRFSIVGTTTTTTTTPRHEGNQDETPPLVATPLEENDMHPPDGESSTSSSNGRTATGGGSGGSSMAGAIFNFTNCIVGAGCIGLGGAFAQSGGAISILSIIVVAWLTKASLDLIIQLSLETPGAHGSYEDLGHVAFGTLGRLVIAASKFLYSFGCLVAYVVVIKDNLAPATFNLLQQGGQCGGHGQGLTLPLLPPFVDPTANRSTTEEGSSTTSSSIFWESLCHVLENRLETTWFACIAIILPLCMLRDMTPLASCSAISIGAIVSVMGIILYLFVANPDDAIQQNSHNHNDMADFYVNWLQIRSGYMECIGTFVFTFASQHTAHLVFHSLKMELRTSRHWNKVSLYSLLIACTLSLSIGMGVYMSFGQEARSDIFDIYPSTPLVDVAKLMLSVTMILTFPLPFFTCRELLITILYCPSPQTSLSSQQQQQLSTTATQQLSTTAGSNGVGDDDDDEEPIRNRVLDDDVDLEDIPPPDEDSVGDGNNEGGSDLEQPLLVQRTSNNGGRTTMSVASDLAVSVQTFLSSSARNWTMVLEDDPKQLKLPYHIALTMKLWLIVVGLAIAAPSLGDVLDLVGCATGTMIAFIVPSCLSFRLRGFSFEAALLFMVGVLVGIIGTLFSLRQLLQDMRLL